MATASTIVNKSCSCASQQPSQSSDLHNLTKVSSEVRIYGSSTCAAPTFKVHTYCRNIVDSRSRICSVSSKLSAMALVSVRARGLETAYETTSFVARFKTSAPLAVISLQTRTSASVIRLRPRSTDSHGEHASPAAKPCFAEVQKRTQVVSCSGVACRTHDSNSRSILPGDTASSATDVCLVRIRCRRALHT